MRESWELLTAGPPDADRTVLLLPGGANAARSFNLVMADLALSGIRLVATTLPGMAGAPVSEDVASRNGSPGPPPQLGAQPVGQRESGLLGVGVEVGEARGELAAEPVDAVGVAERGLQPHGAAVDRFGVRIVPQRA